MSDQEKESDEHDPSNADRDDDVWSITRKLHDQKSCHSETKTRCTEKEHSNNIEEY